MRYVLLLAACLTLLVGMHLAPAGAAQVPQRERWEYATLTAFYAKDEPSYAFIAPDKNVNGTLEEVAEKLGAKIAPGRTATTAVLMNAIGKDGWELVAIEPARSQYMGPMLYFKRRG